MTPTPYQQALGVFRSMAVPAVRALGDQLRSRQFEAAVDPSLPEPSEVRLGFASRQWRMLSYVVTDGSWWCAERAVFVLRAIVDAHIVSSWLMTKDDPALYRRFVDFGRGRLKLYKLHLEDAFDLDGGPQDLGDVLEHLESRVNAEMLEEFQSIDLGGSFAGVSIREMAVETNLKRLYDLVYQPLSAAAHGEWDAMVEHDLEPSSDPLYFGHRFGVFNTRAELTDLGVVGRAYAFASASISAIFADLDIDVSPELEECARALAEAVREAKWVLERSGEAPTA